VPAITAALVAQPGRARELVRVARAAVDPANPATIVNTALNVLWYNVFATNDATQKLGGNPYGNRLKWYWGSSNDCASISWSGASRPRLPPRQPAGLRTSGDPSIPLVTCTTADEVVPSGMKCSTSGKSSCPARARCYPFRSRATTLLHD
jgi:hypothetical protein